MTKKEQLLLLQNTLALVLTGIVLAGTFMPIAFQFIIQRDVSTGAPFFNAMFIPLVLCVLLILLYMHYSFIISTRNVVLRRTSHVKKKSLTLGEGRSGGYSPLPLVECSPSSNPLLTSSREPTLRALAPGELHLLHSTRGAEPLDVAKRSEARRGSFFIGFIILSHFIVFYYCHGFSLIECIYLIVCILLWCTLTIQQKH